jgi:Cellulase M and related proteins
MEEKKFEQYTDYIMEQTKSLLAIDSPSGYTEEAADYVVKTFEELGYKPQKTTKGGVLVCLGGKKTGQGVLLEAHIDTLGGMPGLMIENICCEVL